MRFLGEPNVEFVLNSIVIIPEPSTALLMGLGLAGLGLRRRSIV
ncbi:MAG: PEP-CTERM sorting domain-containing protein [Deltaproteobacteria bacterium]|nr:PEP-CTERM sorting domain-containing protein [Deltaproteobacteria bacterium]